MSSNNTIRNRNGFTLIEVLVTLILLAVLAAAVFPIVTQQSDQGDPVRVANDLGSIRTAVEQFRLDVRPRWPGDLEDLAYEPETGDEDLNQAAIANAAKWNGPYIDLALTETAATVTGDAFTSAFGAEVQNDLICLSAGLTFVDLSATPCAEGDLVAVEIEGLDQAEADKLELLIDGTASTNATGKFRFLAGTPPTGDVQAAYVVGQYF